MLRRIVLMAGIFAALTSPPLPAQAQNMELKSAQELYLEGRTLYQAGKIQNALSKFESALRIVTRSSIILSIAQCHRQLNHRKAALSHYNLYLREWEKQNSGKPAPFLADVEQNITALKKEIKEEEDRASKEKNSTHQRALLEQKLKNEAQKRELEKVRQRQEAEALANAEVRRSKTIWAYTTLGVGIASLAAGGALLGIGITQGDDAYNKYNAATTDAEILGYRNDVQSSEKMMIASYALMGVGAVSLGISLYQFMTRPADAKLASHSENGFSFDVSPRRAQIRWQTRF